MKNKMIILLVCASLLSMSAFVFGEKYGEKNAEEIWQDTTIIASRYVKDKIIILDGNLTISTMGDLLFDNVTIIVNCTFDGQYRIEVMGGGKLRMINNSCVMSTPQNKHAYKFIVHKDGTLRIDNSKVHNCGMDSTELSAEGIYLESDDVIISNSTISSNYVGIILKNGGIVLNSCTIKDNEKGISSDNSTLIINKTLIADNNLTGIDLVSTHMTLTEVAIRNNNKGVNCDHSKIDAYYSKIENNHYGIYSFFSTINLYNTTLSSKEYDLYLNLMSTCEIYNTSLNLSKCLLSENTYLNISWYVDIITYFESGPPVKDAVVSIRDASDVMVFSDKTDEQGRINDIVLQEISKTQESEESRNPYLISLLSDDKMLDIYVNITSNAEILMKLDDVPPEIFIEYPLDGAKLNTSNIEIKGEAYDKHSPIISIEYRVNGGEWNPINITSNFSISWNATISFDDGEHIIDVKSMDVMMNENITNITIKIDTIPPGLSVVKPKDYSFTNNRTCTVEGYTSPDANLTVNGEFVKVDADGHFLHNVTLQEGKNKITVKSCDDVGNTAEVVRYVFLDTIPPLLRILSPINNTYTNKSLIMIKGLTEEKDAKVYINDVPIFVDVNGSFEDRFGLVDGENIIEIKAIDIAGNVYTVYLYIYLDRNPPYLEIMNKKILTNSDTVVLEGHAENGSIVTVNGESVQLKNGTFTVSLRLTEGENIFRVIAMDRAGNTKMQIFRAIRDTVPPVITVTAPIKEYTSLKNIVIKGSAEDKNDINAVYHSVDNGRTWMACEGKVVWSVGVVLEEGVNIILVKAEDYAGNINITKIRIILDSTAPTIIIKSPKAGSVVHKSKITINGSCKDDGIGVEEVEISVNNGSWIKGTGKETWYCEIELKEGKNTIRVKARDSLGNTDIITFNLEYKKEGEKGNEYWGFVAVILIAIIIMFLIAVGVRYSEGVGISGVKCPNCGAAISEDDESCPECGVEFVEEE